MTEPKLPPRLPVKQILPLGRVQRMMAQTMRDSVQRAALSQITREMDLSAVQAARRAASEDRFSVNIYIMAAVARALRNHPMMNAELVEDQVLVYEPVNLGMAITVASGLIVTVVHGADQQSLAQLATTVEELVGRARNGKLTYTDIDGGTFTVTNLGMYGVDGGFPLPRPPEGAILLVGRVCPRPVVVEGALTVGDLAWFSLTYDHRFIEGAVAAQFLLELQDNLLSPGSLGT